METRGELSAGLIVLLHVIKLRISRHQYTVGSPSRPLFCISMYNLKREMTYKKETAEEARVLAHLFAARAIFQRTRA